MTNLVETTQIKTKIYTIRGVKVILDRDLAELYQVTTGNLNKAVKRNVERFPIEFMFQLTMDEAVELSRFQNGILKQGQNIKYLPYVFTEYGTLALSSILKSEIAIKVNKIIIKAFVELRKQVTQYPEYELLREKMKRIESEVKEIKATQTVENRLVRDKIGKVSSDVQILGKNMTEILDEFQEYKENNIIIKRPSDSIEGG